MTLLTLGNERETQDRLHHPQGPQSAWLPRAVGLGGLVQTPGHFLPPGLARHHTSRIWQE